MQISCRSGIFLFLIGGIAYVGLEILWRGFSHWTMFVDGGICFILLTALNNHFHARLSLPLRCLCGGLLITMVELLTGLMVNVLLGWQVWDYSTHSFHFMGQISLMYSILWCLLSAPVFLVSHCLQKRLLQSSLYLHHKQTSLTQRR